MARQYSHTQFFRQTPNVLLARYFHQHHEVLLEFDFDKLKETDVMPIFEAFKTLLADKQVEIEAELQDIDGMACQGGVTALTDEADFHQDTDFTEALAKIEGFHGKVLWTFLEHPNYWNGGSFFLHSDNIAESFWKKRNDLPKVKPAVEPEAIQQLEQAISHYFYSKQGRGRNCKVEVFRRYEKEYFFAYPEDFAQSTVVWIRNTLKSQAHHPAFEIIFVYTQSEGSLDIYAPRNTKYVPDLQEIFGECILKLDELDPFAAENKVYNLDGLADKHFTFQVEASSGIERVLITRLRLNLISGKKQRVTVEANPDNNPDAVYGLLDSLNLPPFHVTQVEMKIIFSALPGKQAKTRRVKISYPNWCGLKHDGDDLMIRQMLAASGIEPIKLETDE
ncbi:MAG: hypothetical protein WC856_26270 [Methylococcaceae bacterium]|jgi:hypothetical protein